jgi:hypothetical protein
MSNFIDPRATYHSGTPYNNGQFLPAAVINALCGYIPQAPNWASGGNYDISSGGPLTLVGGSGASPNYFNLQGTANRLECKGIGIGTTYDASFPLKMSGPGYIGGPLTIDTFSSSFGMSVNNAIVLASKGRTVRASGSITGATGIVTIDVETASRYFVSGLTGGNKTVQINKDIGREGDIITIIMAGGSFQALIQIWNGVSAYVTNTTLGLSAGAGIMRWAEFEFQSGLWVRARQHLMNSSEN